MSKFSYIPCTWRGGDDEALERLSLDWYISEVKVQIKEDDTVLDVCRLQQGVGHCCGATFMTSMKPWTPAYLDALIVEIKSKRHRHLRWQVQPRLFFYLSDETVAWDGPIRARDDVKELYSFMNSATRPYTPSKVTLFVLEFK